MRAQSWTNILNLLAVMVVTNKDDAKTELSLFKRGAMLMKTMIAPDVKLTESMAENWFKENRALIGRQVTSVHYNQTVSDLLKGLNMLPNKPMILTALMKAALSETSSSHNRIFSKASEVWGLEDLAA